MFGRIRVASVARHLLAVGLVASALVLVGVHAPAADAAEKGTSYLAVRGLVLRTSGKITTGTAQARLTDGGGSGLSSKTVYFTVGSKTVCKGTTGTDGNVRCSVNAVNTAAAVRNGGLTGTFRGDALWLPSSGQGGIIS